MPAFTKMEVNPKPLTTKKLKALAQKKGLTLNAFLIPFLDLIAEELLVMHAGPPPGAQVVNPSRLA